MLTIRPAKLGDIKRLTVRPTDVFEVWAVSQRSPAEALARAILACRPHAYTVEIDEEVVAIFGVGPTDEDGVGCPWMLAAKALESAPRSVALASKRVIDQMSKQFHTLRNFVWERNEKSMKWLRWLGFEQGPSVYLYDDGRVIHLFHEYVRTNV